MTQAHIRNAAKSDAELILKFITDLAIYEKAENEVTATADDIRQSLFNQNATAKALICEINGQAIGFAVYFYNYSTWLGKKGLYLEDLYIDPEHRGSGGGKALLQHLAKIALDENCERFEWSVLDWNTPSIEFYDSIGAVPKSEWLGYRLSGDALQRMAHGS